MRIGVDVGGTNTDVVLINENIVVGWRKTPTTKDISSGIITVINEVLAEAKVSPDQIVAVMIGTTHFTNAVVERKRLLQVAVIRLGLPATIAVRPMSDWPKDLASQLGGHIYLAHGGHEFDGRTISTLDMKELNSIALDIRMKGLKAASVTSVFSPVNKEMEDKVRDFLNQEVPDLSVSLSNEIGRVGFLERENACIMNACLLDLAQNVVQSFSVALKKLQINAPFFISQNDGTLMTAEHVKKYPVLTFASGPTNSMRGAAKLAGISDAMVVDIGGTTSDVGMLLQGFPRDASVGIEIGGVRTNFRMPDVLALGLGGGTIVHDNGLRLGPESVGFELIEKALVFGGEVLTTTDIIVAAGIEDIGDRSLVKHLSGELIKNCITTIHNMIDAAVDKMKTSSETLPIILVGGGSVLVSQNISSGSKILKPDFSPVANAIGAAISQVGGEVDRIFSLDSIGRDNALEKAKSEATEKAIRAGASPKSIKVVDIEEVPLAYLPSSASRIRVKVVGDLELKK